MSDEGEKSSWLEPLPEEYTAEGDMTGRRMLVAALTVIVLAVFGGLIWYSYMAGADNGPVPVVRADKSVVREKPDNPGGMQVLNQDKRVFDRVASDKAEKNESLGPSAELPVERPVANDSPVKKIAEDIKQPEAEKPDLQPEVVARKVAEIAPAVKGKAGKFLVQLGAFGKKTTAEQLWRKLQKDNTILLAGLDADIMMVDLGKKGVLYRLRGGMIATRSNADTICQALKLRKQACIVVTR